MWELYYQYNSVKFTMRLIVNKDSGISTQSVILSNYNIKGVIKTYGRNNRFFLFVIWISGQNTIDKSK